MTLFYAMSRDPDTAIGRGAGRFPATRRSTVAAAASADRAERARALEVIVEIYWKPAYKHLRLHWSRSNEDAKDLTQGFFSQAIERDVFASYDPGLGTFRTFLRTCLDRFVSNEAKADSRLKRGGGATVLPLDFAAAEAEFAQGLRGAATTPEEQFYREWARSLFALAVDELRAECVAEEKESQFLLFERYDLDPAPGDRPTYAKLGAELGIPETTVTNQLFAARRRFRRIVLERLREATVTEAEFREEAQRLLGGDRS